MKHGIKPKYLRAIRDILKNNCAAIERVGLFGSRATGRFTRVQGLFTLFRPRLFGLRLRQSRRAERDLVIPNERQATLSGAV